MLRGEHALNLLFWAGIIVSIIGFLGLMWCIYKAIIIRKQNKKGLLDKTQLQQGFAKLAMFNMASLGLSFFGLVFLLMGLFV